MGDNPLGPFEYVENNSFSFKPGGFIGGAGHGHTFRDKYGNYWHVASMTVSVRHMFERRLGLFPVTVSSERGFYAHTLFFDYPFAIPDRKVDFEKEDIRMGWRLLSYRKNVSASSFLPGYEPARANDEQVETWWAAATGKKGEWLQVDLGKAADVYAIQVNFADHQAEIHPPHPPVVYRYVIEGSLDGKNWIELADKRQNAKDAPHELCVPDTPSKVRYVRITNEKETSGCFSLFDLRVFGQDGAAVPGKVTGFRAERDAQDKRIYRFRWDAQTGATGYVLRWGTRKDRLIHAVSVYDTVYESRYFNRDSPYYFSIEAF